MIKAPTDGGRETTIPLANLLLDANNPRFGGLAKNEIEQSKVLDFIVERFGIDDVLSSLSVNGYFEAEPVVCRRTKNGKDAVVVEGNRRLAACLILAGDPRASRQTKRAAEFQDIWNKHGRKNIDPVPAIVFDEDESKELLSYLGVRHIAASQPWDSYAKAAWVARVVEQEQLNIPDVALMIGDQHRTIARLLEGYYFINQIINAGGFRPSDSIRRGRGSVSDYPFSWVYTVLGYATVRAYLGFDDNIKQNPLSDANISRAALLTSAMFGDRSLGRNSAIQDSRQLGALASVFGSAEKISLLENGKTVEEIVRLTRPIEDRLRQGLADIRGIQTDLLSGITETGISALVAEPLISLASMNRRASAELEKKLRDATSGSGHEDE